MVVGLAAEPVPKILAFKDGTGVSFPLLLDETDYTVYEDPTGSVYALEVVVDRRGIIRHTAHGDTTQELETVITALLAEG